LWDKSSKVVEKFYIILLKQGKIGSYQGINQIVLCVLIEILGVDFVIDFLPYVSIAIELEY
jgi:hypothetical protein